MPRGLDHIALVVRDPARSAQMLGLVFEGAEVHLGQGDHDTHVRVGGVTLVLVEGVPPAGRNGDHIAFAVDRQELEACAGRLRAQGIEVQMARGDTALYFTDYDNHVFELDVVDD